jgi:DNA-damage-inducible protein J
MRKRGEKTQMIRARVDLKLKKSAERIFTRIGITTTDAIRLFLKQVELHRGLPFPVLTPKEETIDAMLEANDAAALNRYHSFQKLRNRDLMGTWAGLGTTIRQRNASIRSRMSALTRFFQNKSKTVF